MEVWILVFKIYLFYSMSCSKIEKSAISNVCLGGCTITKTKINVWNSLRWPFERRALLHSKFFSKNVDFSLWGQQCHAMSRQIALFCRFFFCDFTNFLLYFTVCRAWMKNEPHNTNMAPRLRTPTPEPDPLEQDGSGGEFFPWNQIHDFCYITLLKIHAHPWSTSTITSHMILPKLRIKGGKWYILILFEYIGYF